MPYNKLKLISPNNTPIIGVKLTNGEVGEIECSYDNKTENQDWVVPLNMVTKGDCYIFIDESNKEWIEHPSDVAYRSIIA
jgi:hypothetical protein